METQAQERFEEIKREIIEISESYTLIKQNMSDEKAKAVRKGIFNFYICV